MRPLLVIVLAPCRDDSATLVAAIAIGACVSFGMRISTMSMSRLDTTPRQSVAYPVKPYWANALRATTLSISTTTLRSISSGKPKRSGATAVTTEWALPMTYGFIGKLEPNFRLRITRPRTSAKEFCARNEAAGEKTRIRAIAQPDQALTTINPTSSSGRVSFADAPASTISVCARSTPPMQNGEAVLSFDAHASTTVSAARAASVRFT